MPEATTVVKELEAERAQLVARLGKVDKALDQIMATASALTTNGQTDKPKKAKKKKRTRRSTAEIANLKSRVALMKSLDPDRSPADIHKALVGEGLMTDTRNDYQLCVRTAKGTAAPVAAMPSPEAPEPTT